MCLDPATMLFISQAAQAVVGFVNQSEQADRAEQAHRDNYNAQMQAVARQQEQANAQAAEKMSQRAREARIEQAKLRVIGAESGLAGLSQERVMRESLFNEGTDLASIEGNRRRTQEQITADAEGLRAQSQSRINTINRPSLIGTGLQIAGAYYGMEAEKERTKRIDGTNRRTTAVN